MISIICQRFCMRPNVIIYDPYDIWFVLAFVPYCLYLENLRAMKNIFASIAGNLTFRKFMDYDPLSTRFHKEPQAIWIMQGIFSFFSFIFNHILFNIGFDSCNRLCLQDLTTNLVIGCSQRKHLLLAIFWYSRSEGGLLFTLSCKGEMEFPITVVSMIFNERQNHKQSGKYKGVNSSYLPILHLYVRFSLRV